MTIPIWFLAIVAGAAVAQGIALIYFLHHTDKKQDRSAEAIGRVEALLAKHELPVMHAEIKTLQSDSKEHYAAHERNRSRIDEFHGVVADAFRRDTPASMPGMGLGRHKP